MRERVCACLLLLSPALLRGQIAREPDAREIVRRSVAAEDKSQQIRRNYTYKSLNVVRESDSGGKVRSTRSTLSEVLFVGGRPFRYVLERDGKPVPAEEGAKAKATLDAAVNEAAHLSPAERKIREEQYVKSTAKRRDLYNNIPDAFNFRIVGQKSIDGRDTWEMRASPNHDYKGPFASAFHNMEGTLWIDKNDYQWVKVEADSLETISFGWILARIGKGSRLTIENMRLNNELWAPKRLTIHASGRVALVKKLNADQETTYSDYRKFQTDSKLVDYEPAK
jgi:hypothetical protein